MSPQTVANLPSQIHRLLILSQTFSKANIKLSASLLTDLVAISWAGKSSRSVTVISCGSACQCTKELQLQTWAVSCSRGASFLHQRSNSGVPVTANQRWRSRKRNIRTVELLQKFRITPDEPEKWIWWSQSICVSRYLLQRQTLGRFLKCTLYIGEKNVWQSPGTNQWSRRLPFSQITTEAKRSSVVFPRATVGALAGFLDAFQKVADMANNSRGKMIPWLRVCAWHMCL